MSITFSPDGRRVAFVWVKNLDWPIGFEPPTLSQTAYVRWCTIDRPTNRKSVKVDSFGPSKSGYSIQTFIDLMFSPDSRHLAVLSPHLVTIIDLESETKWRLTRGGEIVTSLVWLGNEEVAYAAHSNIGGHKEVADRTFGRHKIHSRSDERVAIYAEKGVETGIDTWTGYALLEHWSPAGRYVIFLTPSPVGRFHLLDLDRRSIRPFGHPSVSSWKGVSWKPDGSAAVCVSQVGMQKPDEALLIDAATGETYDFSESFAEVFGEFSPRIGPLWPAGSEYFIANDLELGGCLVRPRPWRVIQVGKQLCKHLGTPDAKPPSIYRLPQANWVRVQAKAGTALSESEWYGFDCERERFVELADAGWAWSSDGRRNGKVKYDGTIIIQEVDPSLFKAQKGTAP